MGNVEQGRAEQHLSLEKANGCPPSALSTQQVRKQGQEHCRLLSEQLLSKGAQQRRSPVGDPFSHGKALLHFSELSDLPVPLARPPSTLVSGVGGGKQSMPDHESSMRPSYDQGCTAAIGAVCPEQGTEQL